MRINKKTALITASAALCVNLISSILYYAASGLSATSLLSYISSFYSLFSETVLPIICAAMMLLAYAKHGMRKPFAHCIFYSLAWFIPLFARYFSEYLGQSADLTYSLFFALLSSLFLSLAMYFEISVLFLIIIFAARIFASKNLGRSLDSTDILSADGAFDFTKPTPVGIFSASLALFFYNIGIEIANTVRFISDSAGVFTIGEIFYLLARYVFILALLLLAQKLAHLAKAFFLIKE